MGRGEEAQALRKSCREDDPAWFDRVNPKLLMQEAERKAGRRGDGILPATNDEILARGTSGAGGLIPADVTTTPSDSPDPSPSATPLVAP